MRQRNNWAFQQKDYVCSRASFHCSVHLEITFIALIDARLRLA